MRYLLPFSALFLLIAFSCISPEKEKQTVFTATLKGPSAISMIYMIDEKPVIAGKFNSVFEIKNEPNQVKAMIIEGTPDFAVVPTTMAALLYNINNNYILAAIPVWGTLYLFGSDTSILSWKDLKNKRVSLMGQGNTPDVLFRYLAKANGMNPDTDFQLDYSFPGHIELANAIASEASPLGVISEPMVSLVQSKNPKIKALMDLNLEWEKHFGDSIPLAQTALLVNKKFLAKHPEVVEEYLEKLKNSISRVNANVNESAALVKKYDILPDSAMAVMSIPRCNIKFGSVSKEKQGIQEYLKVFFNFNPLILGGKMPDEEFYYEKAAH